MFSKKKRSRVRNAVNSFARSRTRSHHKSLTNLTAHITRQTCIKGQKNTVFAHHARLKLIKEVLLKRFEAGQETSQETVIGMMEILNDPQAGSIVPRQSNDVDSMNEVVMERCLKLNRRLKCQATIDEVRATYFMTTKERRKLTPTKRAVRNRQRATLRQQGIKTAEEFVDRAVKHKQEELIYLTKVAQGNLLQTENQYHCGPPPFNTTAAKMLLWHSWSQAAVIAPKLCMNHSHLPRGSYWRDIFPNQQPPYQRAPRELYDASKQSFACSDSRSSGDTRSVQPGFVLMRYAVTRSATKHVPPPLRFPLWRFR